MDELAEERMQMVVWQYSFPAKSIDQYYLENPHELLGNDYEDLCVLGVRDMECGKMILERHLQCAAYEEPIELDDIKWLMPGGSKRTLKMF